MQVGRGDRRDDGGTVGVLGASDEDALHRAMVWGVRVRCVRLRLPGVYVSPQCSADAPTFTMSVQSIGY
jgi:hypothetical protein